MMGQGPWAWFVARLDGFLSESLRRGTPLELGRARLLAGVCLGLLVCDVLILLHVLLGGGPRSVLLMGVLCAAGFGGALVMLRRSSSTRTLGLLLCSLVTAGTINSSLQLGSLVVATHASVMLIPVLSVYLLGWRLGLLFSAVASVNVGLVFPLQTWGTLAGPDQALCVFAALYVLCAWAVGWLFISARDEAQARVERMVRTLREGEGQLLSIIQSTDDVVLSLDKEGRVVTANDAARQLFQRVMGRELHPGELAFKDFAPEEQARWRGYLTRALQGERVKDELNLPLKERTLTLELTVSPFRGEGERVVGTTLFGHDITARKESEARLSEMHRALVDVSRQAGMAEIATSVLHNVGNTLNSVYASMGLVNERLLGLRVGGLSRAVELMDEHAADLSAFLTTDSRGQLLPAYLKQLAQKFTEDRERGLTELRTLAEHVEHIGAVVNMQARDTRSTWMVKERLPVPELLDDALRMLARSFEQVGIEIRREYAPVPPPWVDRHRLLLILVNLVSNARQALQESERPDKQLTLRVGPGEAGRLRIEVADNGVGIAPEHLPHLFSQGFTTKKDGHGFGLHASALAAEELHGSISCTSAGVGQGATFILELPLGSEPLVGESNEGRPGLGRRGAPVGT